MEEAVAQRRDGGAAAPAGECAGAPTSASGAWTGSTGFPRRLRDGDEARGGRAAAAGG